MELGSVPGDQNWIERSAEVERIVTVLTSGDTNLVVVVPEPEGVEGLGLSAVAAVAARRPEVRERFTGGLAWVSCSGKQPHEASAELTRVVEEFAGAEDGFAELEELLTAGPEMETITRLIEEAVADPGRRLIVVDGALGAPSSLPFALLGCTWLITTLRTDELPPAAVTVPVGPLAPAEGAALLRREFPPMREAAALRLAELTGGWPLALDFARAAIRSQAAEGQEITEAATRIAEGIAQRLPGRPDLADPARRAALIGSLVDHALGLLYAADTTAAERFLDLGVFEEEPSIPVGVAATLWSTRGRITAAQAEALIARLAGLSLLQWHADRQLLVLEPSVRAHVRHLLGPDGVARAHCALVDADPDQAPQEWTDLPGTAEWMFNDLPRHCEAAGATRQLEELVCGVEWLTGRMTTSNLEAVVRDLSRASSEEAELLRRTLSASAHLFDPTPVRMSILSTLACRLHAVPGKAQQIHAWLRQMDLPWLESRWTPPDLPHPALLHTLGEVRDVLNDVAIASDGTWLAAAGRISVWCWRLDGTLLAALAGHPSPVSSVAISPDGTWLATGSGPAVYLWQVDGTLLSILTDHPGEVRSVAIAPDGTWLAATGEGFTQLWNSDGARRAALQEPMDDQARVAIAPDGTWLAVTGRSRAGLWNADGTPKAILDETGPGEGAVAIAPDGQWLAVNTEDGSVRLLNTDGTERDLLEEANSSGGGLAITPDARRLVLSDDDERVVVLDVDGTVRGRLHGHFNAISALAISPDGNLLISASKDGTIRIWDADTAVQEGMARQAGRRELDAVAIAPDGSWLATAGLDGLTLWNGDGSQRGDDPDLRLTSLAIAPDGTWLASGDTEEVLRLHDVDGTVRETIPLRERRRRGAAIGSVAIAPDGAWMAVTLDDRALILTAGGRKTATLDPRSGKVNAVAIAPDSSWLAVATDSGLQRWNAQGHKLGADMPAETSVEAMAISPDGRLLAAVTMHGLVELWDPSGTRVAHFGIDGLMTGVAFSPDGAWLATTAWQGPLRVWDVATRRCQAVVHLDGYLSDCAWFPDGSGVCATGTAGLYGFTFNP
jgi:WD40 repeat protein